jgi:hypothetical protein
MADVVRTAFGRLSDQQYAPIYPAPGAPSTIPTPARVQYSVRMSDLLDAGLLAAGAVLINPTDDVEATVQTDGRLAFDGTLYDSPSGASVAAHGGSTHGWAYWLADTPTGLRSLASLRDDLLASSEADQR